VGRISLTKKIIGSRVGFGSGFGSNIVRFFEFLVILGRVLSSSGHLGFWVIRVRAGSGFRSSDIG
jgi:hypothetical protein